MIPPRLTHLGIALCLFAISANAEEDSKPNITTPDVQVTNTAIMELRTDNENGDDTDDDYGVALDRLNINSNMGDLSASARLDGAFFLSPPLEIYQSQIRLERANIAFRHKNWTFEAGDHYEQLGSGLALSTRKLDEAGVDISILGARAAYMGSDQSFRVFAGKVNPANIDAVSQRYVRDTNDVLAGANYESTHLDWLRAGTYFLYNQPEETLLDSTDFTVTGGGYAAFPSVVDWFEGSLEVAVQERYLAEVLQTGVASYLNTVFRVEDFSVLVEGLALNDFEQNGSNNTALANRFRYNRPPTLERLDQEVINNRDTLGGRIRPEYFFFTTETLIYANFMTRLNDPFEDSALLQLHGFAGFEQSFDEGASRFALASGYREERQLVEEEPIKTIVHVDVDYLQSLGKGFSLHLTSNTWFRTFSQRDYVFGISIAGVEKAGLGSLAFELGYDTFDPSPGVRNIFYAGILSWEINSELNLRAIVGNQRGGLKCVAGVCREYPAFSGARAVLVTRF